jgi:hypothetical protein
MGQLRTSILNLQKLIINNPKRLEVVQKALKPGNLKVEELGKTADEGWDLIFMHLTNKFKKEGSTVAANADKKLSEVIDPGLAKLIKGVDDWRKNMLSVSSKYTKTFDQGIAAINADLSSASVQVKNLRAIANKKKKKWLVSPKYKAKIKGYIKAIDDIESLINSQKKQLAQAKGLQFNDAWVNKWFSIKANMTVKDFENRASMGTKGIMKTYLANQAEADKYVRKWRDEYKGMAGQLKAMKQWTNDADDMEVEDTGGKDKGGDGSGKIKSIKILSGGKEIGTADKGEFIPKKPMKIVVKWGKKADDPLSLLKKKVTVKASFVEKGRGNFVNDFKVDKILGDMKTITLS